MKKGKKNPVYIRYEFSDEKGRPEGGDIFEFSSLQDVMEMTSEILKVAKSDGVSVNLTIGEEKPFFGFLNHVGLTREQAEQEIVSTELAPIFDKKKAKPKAKKTAKKTARKK